MTFLQNIFGRGRRRASLAPLYAAIVARGRDPFWYREGQVPDTLDGRFDMVAALTALVLIRLEEEGAAGAEPSVLLTETFIDDMTGTLRQIGIGDYVVAKHVGNMVGALGGRHSAFAAARSEGTGFALAVRRNIFHDAPPCDDALALATEQLERFSEALDRRAFDDLMVGRLP